MMPALNPAVDTAAIPAGLASSSSAPGEGTGSTPFANLIQGLQQADGTASPDGLPSGATSAQQAVAQQPLAQQGSAIQAVSLTGNTTATADPLAGDDLTSALTTVLQALGLGESTALSDASDSDRLETDSDGDSSATALSSPPPALHTDLMLPAAILPSATRPASLTSLATPASTSAGTVATDLLPASTESVGVAAPADGLLSNASRDLPADASTSARQQTRSWLAAMTPVDPGSNTPVPTVVPSSASLLNAGSLSSLMASTLAGSTDAATGARDGLAPVSDALLTGADSLQLLADGSPGGTRVLSGGLGFAQTLTQAAGQPASGLSATLATVQPHALQDPAWSDAFGQRVALLAQQGTQTATLQLNPPELGPIQVRIALAEQGARVEFNTAQQTTSDLITHAMPRLAAALEHQGLRLDDSRVNLVSHRHDFSASGGAFTADRQGTPQGDRGSADRGQGSGQSGPWSSRLGAGAETMTDDSGGRQRSMTKDPERGIDYYA